MTNASKMMVILLTLFGAPAIVAQCPDINGPITLGSFMWYEYGAGQSCYATSGSVTSGTVGCSGANGWAFGMGWVNKAEFTFTVGSEVIDPTRWTAGSFVEFDDPNDSIYNMIEVRAIVRHPNNTVDQYVLFNWSGPLGDLNGCVEQWDYFAANTGDEVTIHVKSTKWYSNTVIRASVPKIFNTN